MDLKLRVIQGKNIGQDVPVPGKKFLIGRAEDCNLRPGSDLISRHHCVIIVEEDFLSVRDFGSKNGTFVNDEPVVGESELKQGDRLKVGPLEFEIVVTQGALGGKKKPPVHDAKEAATRTAARASDNDDVSAWLGNSDKQPQSAQDTKLVRLSDTDEIDVGRTRDLETPVPGTLATVLPAAEKPAVGRLAPVPAAASVAAQSPQPTATGVAAAVASKAAVATKAAEVKPASKPAPPKPVAATTPATILPKDSPPLPQLQQEEPAAETAEAESPSAVKRGGSKTYGKLPPLPNASKDSREAATNMLNKFRKRR